MGIVVTPIAPAPNGSAAVLIPVTALVDADSKQLTFVQYENFYEPVPVTTGATQGDLIEVTGGLSVGEKLVTQGGLSLYAESRKTQTATASSSPAAAPATDPATIASPANTHAQADAQGIPHSHDAAGNLVATNGVAEESSGGLMGMLAALGGGAAVIFGAIAVLGNSRKKKGTFSSKKGDL